MKSAILQSPDTLKQLQLRGQQVAEIFRLPLRRHTWRGGSGEFAGAGAGSSLEFQDHRAYLAGDDPRHINWQAYARTGQYTMKVFREEVRPLVDLVCDVSASQWFDDVKARRVVELLHFCAAAAIKAGASLQTYLVNGGQGRMIGNELLWTNRWVSEIPMHRPASDLPEAPNLTSISLRSQAMRIFISDALYPGSPESVLRALSDRQGRGMMLIPYCQAESAVQWEGNYEFVEPESDSHHLRRVDARLLKRYHEAYQRHFQLWKNETMRYGVQLARVAAEPTLEEALQTEAQVTGTLEMA